MNVSQMDLMRMCKGACIALLAVGSMGSPAALADEHWLRKANVADLNPLTTDQRYQAFVTAQQSDRGQNDAFSTSAQVAEDSAQVAEDSAQVAEDSAQVAEDEGQTDDSVHQRMTKFSDGRFELPSIAAPSIATGTIGNGRTPDGFRDGASPLAQPLPESGSQRGEWNWTIAPWAAANTFSNPRYFEDRMLERHGHERFPKLQPMISGARFFATIPALPYLMTLSHPGKCESTLGYFRTGSATPGLKQCPPWDRKAAMVQAGAVAGGILAFP